MLKIDGEIFIDWDGKTFELLLNYLRNERLIFPEFKDENMQRSFFMELYYWDIDKKNPIIKKKIQTYL